MSYWRDPEFHDRLLTFACKDRNFLKRVSGLLDEVDFKPKKGESPELYIIAEKAFEYWREYGEPISGMLRTEMLDFARENRLPTRPKEKLMDLVDRIRNADGLVAVEALEKKVVEYKSRIAKRDAINQLIELQEGGDLTDEAFFKTLDDVQSTFRRKEKIIDLVANVKKRIKRRRKERGRKFPLLMIDAIDKRIKTIPRGHIALLLAKYKKGKSVGLVWIAQSMAMQGYNVLYFTLEDSIDVVTDRFDASLTGIALKEMNTQVPEFKRRFRRARRDLSGRIKIVDGTEGGMSIARMAEIWDRYRNQGFEADVVVVDYDDEIVPPQSYKTDSGRRREFADIYREFRKFCAKRNIWGWTAAQTRRGKDDQEIVHGDDAAEDISKIRKVALAIGIGAGPKKWGTNNEAPKDSRTLFIAVHKFDEMGLRFPIMGDFKAALLYDAEETRKMLERHEKHDKRRKTI